eukprot:3901385-Amphidinium_carterae.1
MPVMPPSVNRTSRKEVWDTKLQFYFDAVCVDCMSQGLLLTLLRLADSAANGAARRHADGVRGSIGCAPDAACAPE